MGLSSGFVTLLDSNQSVQLQLPQVSLLHCVISLPKQITNVLIRLLGYASRPAPFLFAKPQRQVLSRVKAHYNNEKSILMIYYEHILSC